MQSLDEPNYDPNYELTDIEKKNIIAFAVPISLHVIGILITLIFTIAFKHSEKKYKSMWNICVTIISLCELCRDICFIMSMASETVRKKKPFPICPASGYFNIGVIYSESYAMCFLCYTMFRSLAKVTEPLTPKKSRALKKGVICGSIIILVIIVTIAALTKPFEVGDKSEVDTCWFNMNRDPTMEEEVLKKSIVKQVFWQTLQWIISIVIQIGFIIAIYVAKRKLINNYRKNGGLISSKKRSKIHKDIIRIAESETDTIPNPYNFTGGIITNNINEIGKKKTLQPKPKSSCYKRAKERKAYEKQVIEQLIAYDDLGDDILSTEDSYRQIYTPGNSSNQSPSIQLDAKILAKIEKKLQKQENKDIKLISFTFWFEPLILVFVSVGAFIADNIAMFESNGLDHKSAAGLRYFSYWIVSNGVFLPFIYVLPMILIAKK